MICRPLFEETLQADIIAEVMSARLEEHQTAFVSPQREVNSAHFY